MTNTSANKRIDSASRVIMTSPQKIYQAFLNRESVASWRPPEGMTCRIYEFNPQEGGTFRMSFEYNDAEHPVSGKTSDHADVFRGVFLELIPDQRIVELIEFESPDPAFAGKMTVTTELVATPGGTEVTINCENVPEGIKPSDHYEGMTSTLKNLAAFTE